MKSFNNTRLFTLAMLVFIISSCARNPVTGKREVVLMSESQEINMGKSYDPQVLSSYGLYNDAKLQAFITEKGKQMAAISHRPSLPYEFKIVDSPVVNAFAVPGGYVYFTRGIMAHFNNEAEFAGVLGHELGHITARHSVKQQRNQMLGQILLIGGMVISEDFRSFAGLASQGMGLLFLKFGRGHESQSDELGVDYSSQIGYDAREMAGFFNTLKKMRDNSGSATPTFMSTHPDPVDRYNKVQAMAIEKQRENPNQTYNVGRDSYLKMIDGIVYGVDPRQGFVDDNMFYHPELRFQFPVPSSWRVNNMPVQVQMSPKDGKAVLTMDLASGNDFRGAARKFAEENKVTILEQKMVRVNGNNALAMISEKNNNNNQGQAGQSNEPALRMLTYLIQLGGKIYRFNGLSKVEDFNTYFSTFEYVIKRFDKLNDASKINIKPVTIRARPAKSTGNLQSVLAAYGMRSQDMSKLSLLNGMELNETVKNGTLVKVFEAMGGGKLSDTILDVNPDTSGGVTPKPSSSTGGNANPNGNNQPNTNTQNGGSIKNNNKGGGSSGSTKPKTGGTTIGGKGNVKKDGSL